MRDQTGETLAAGSDVLEDVRHAAASVHREGAHLLVKVSRSCIKIRQLLRATLCIRVLPHWNVISNITSSSVWVADSRDIAWSSAYILRARWKQKDGHQETRLPPAISTTNKLFHIQVDFITQRRQQVSVLKSTAIKNVSSRKMQFRLMRDIWTVRCG